MANRDVTLSEMSRSDWQVQARGGSTRNRLGIGPLSGVSILKVD